MATSRSTRVAIETARSVRCFSTASPRFAPPTSTKKVVRAPKVNIYAQRKGMLAGDESTAGGGQGLGNVLSEVTLPPPDLSGLPAFEPELLTPKVIGDVMAYPDSTVAAFKAFSLPPLLQKEFAYNKRPSTVVRQLTLDIASVLDSSKTAASTDSRHILTGPAGSGKSVALLQAVSYALSTNWIVLYLPSATPLVDSSSPYNYSQAQAIFHQPALSALLLLKFAAANKSSFKALKTSQSWTFGERTVKAGEALSALVAAGKDERFAVPVFDALMEELAAQTTYPVLLAIDDAQGLFATSSYIDPNYRPLESYSLSVPRTLLSYISNTKSFKSGSIMLAHCPLSKNRSAALTQYLASPELPSNDVYSGILTGIKSVAVPVRLSRKEAVGVVKMLQSWRGDREPVSDQLFLERFIATNGNPREFTRSLGRSLSD